ncbi:NADH-quinone oxidoreductase subunit N [Buchnera aphidicola]|uniref:NADH-quinone oxidoreductase subunit N n=1 Tax=Buchnera aphidicola (Artemisaphis artemisicola) TaxID=1241836 RepID=A0A4D6XKC2_9GAMM|nr:NADH-quinone oxidoreductase subunit N [Buchnera aphidicola]QCI15857.1 NADH-quinone oxidoreductase subunit N [Buchnera aphidicola (Artemisaphis artemisicola)]
MTINFQQLTVLLPLLIVIFTAVTVILSISYNRNHFFIAILSIVGLICSFFSLYLLFDVIPIDVTTLFHIDSYSILYIGMIIISSISTCIFAYPWLVKYQFNKEEFYLLILISTLGAISLIISNHMASYFINIELISLPIVGLIAYSDYEKYSLEASFKYIILSAISSSFLLLGIAWIYAISGNLEIISIHQIFKIASEKEILVVLFGIFMILFSLCFKLSLVPFHLWTPDVYQGTPIPVLSFLSTSGKIAIFSILLHLLSHISDLDNKILFFAISIITISSILIGNTMALFQNNIKRLFGYSSISQFGYLLIVVLVSNKNYQFSLETTTIYLFNYLLSNIVCFGIINLIENTNRQHYNNSITSYKGLFWSQPILSSILTLALLSLSGIPMTLGFIGKFYILSIIIKERLWMIGISFAIGTILGLYCYLRILLNLYLSPVKYPERTLNISSNLIYTPTKIVIFILGILLFILGLYPDPLMKLVQLFQLNSY